MFTYVQDKELKKIGKRWKKDYVAIWDNLLKRMK